jgi:hypothetical protein
VRGEQRAAKYTSPVPPRQLPWCDSLPPSFGRHLGGSRACAPPASKTHPRSTGHILNCARFATPGPVYPQFPQAPVYASSIHRGSAPSGRTERRPRSTIGAKRPGGRPLEGCFLSPLSSSPGVYGPAQRQLPRSDPLRPPDLPPTVPFVTHTLRREATNPLPGRYCERSLPTNRVSWPLEKHLIPIINRNTAVCGDSVPRFFTFYTAVDSPVDNPI